jgi:hydroxyethylthiazole kinase
VVLDPVGAGATRFRTETAGRLLAEAAPTIIRGNASEIRALAKAGGDTKGVDSTHTSEEALDAARSLAARRRCVVVVSGATDMIVADARVLRVHNGHPMMPRVTGLGCTATALVGAFAAVQPDAWRATVAAMACLGVVGELAVERTQAAGAGVGRLQIELLDGLQLLQREAFTSRLKLDVRG